MFFSLHSLSSINRIIGDLNSLKFDKFIEYKIYVFYRNGKVAENPFWRQMFWNFKKTKRPKGHFNIFDLSGTSTQLE